MLCPERSPSLSPTYSFFPPIGNHLKCYICKIIYIYMYLSSFINNSILHILFPLNNISCSV